jgi:hypothetical protein
MKKGIVIALLFMATMLAIGTLTSCTKNEMARNYGGSMDITLQPHQRVQNVTWKETDLWILTKEDTTPPTTYKFEEKSTYGIMEGTINIIEH